MCGIAGSTRADAATLQRMVARLAHRGPDASGTWHDETSACGLGHTRLAVIDLSPASAQPMLSSCGRYALTFNGEIYNFAELRRELEADGQIFRSSGDTEVLLHWLRRHGTAGLARIVGMFAFAFWDRESRELLLARDHVGVKPLVYAPLADGNLAFASEIQALRAYEGIDLAIDRDALSEYLACLYVPAPRTIHRGIRKLPPGHFLRWRAGTTELRRFWAPRIDGARRASVDEAVEELLPLIRRAVERQMVSDVPLGCFLSGGIDSSVIAALMTHKRGSGERSLRTFTMKFDEAAYDESAAARRIAQHLGAEHTELPATSRLVELLDDAVVAFGEPFDNPTSLLIHDLARKARKHVTVVLVGDGGDEVFAGYPRYQGALLAQKLEHLPQWMRGNALTAAASLIPESQRGWHSFRRAREFLGSLALDDADRYARWVEYFDPLERAALLGGEPASPIAAVYRAAPSADALDAMQYTDLVSFLPGNILAYGDAMSMRHALELRPPLLDPELIDAVGRFATSTRFARGKKTLLRAVARRLLPSALVGRRKRGFNPPIGVWMRGEGASVVAERLTPRRLEALGIAWPPVERLLAEQRRGLRDHTLKIWALLVLDAWWTGLR
jgi:asparagine synthase (glutamine-hydrolysing)